VAGEVMLSAELEVAGIADEQRVRRDHSQDPASIANGASSIVPSGDISLRCIEKLLATTLN
jgi:hypothetical protein